MSIVARWRTEAAGRPRRIILADAGDPRAVEAAKIINAAGFATATVAGVTDGSDDQLTPAMAAVLDGLERPVDPADPLVASVLKVAAGEADACVAGAGRPTADVLRAGLRVLGTSPGNASVSSSFLFVLPADGPLAYDDRRHLAYGDCGVIPAPEADQLADIAVATAATFSSLTGEQPRVAMLSFSTNGSADHATIDVVRQATERVRVIAPDLAVDGELQFDAAWDARVAASKAPGSGVAGRANVFIFPDLNAGNIAYKITERLAGAQAFGPLLQGLNGVVHDLSRGCSVDDIVTVAAIAAVQASGNGSVGT